MRRARTEAAAQLLTSTSLPMTRVAARCGFHSAETLRQAFTAQYGTSPSFYHQRALCGEGGHPALTLTTFLDVPWNGPYYRRCGFRLLAADEITPGLRALRDQEAARGLDRWPRGCMRRDL